MNASPPKTLENIKCKTWPYWLPVVLYAAGIFWLSSKPSSDFPSLFLYADKLVHLVLYTGFAFFVSRAVSVHCARVDRFTIWISVVIVAVYGATDEWHQLYVPTRSCDVWDWTADLMGAIAGSFLFVIYNYRTLKRYLALKERMEKNP